MVDPRVLARTLLEQALDPSRDHVEFAVVDPVDEDHACVRAGRFGPFAQDARKVSDVVGDENALLGRAEREHAAVGETFELPFLVKRPNVVPVLAKRSTDSSPRHVGVEKQSHH